MNLWFVTPVHERFELTEVCLKQRAHLLEELPFEANAVVVGNDRNLELAESFGMGAVELGNDWLGAKFNAGYRYALDHGATHCMAIGSDSWLHPSALEGVKSDQRAYGLTGLSSFSPYGEERVDLCVKYAAGFGVGMLYPAFALDRAAQCSPDKQRGCDNSTWARCGRGHVTISFLQLRPYSYTNFHSTDVQVTDYKAVSRGTSRLRARERDRPFDVLHGLYPDELVEEIEGLYAARSFGVFLTGKREVLERRKPSKKYKLNRSQRARRKTEVAAERELATQDKFRALL